MEAQLPDFSATFLGTGMHEFFWGSGMWIFPLGMMIVMLVMALVMCGRGARLFRGHVFHGARHGDTGEDPLEILKRRYAKGEITKDEFDRITKDVRGGSAA